MPTAVLTSSVVALYAVDLPLPVEMTALVMVGLILRVFLRRDDHRFQRIETDVEQLRRENQEQRHLKHEYRNQLTALQYALSLTLAEAERCSCGALDTIRPTLKQIIAREEATPT